MPFPQIIEYSAYKSDISIHIFLSLIFFVNMGGWLRDFDSQSQITRSKSFPWLCSVSNCCIEVFQESPSPRNLVSLRLPISDILGEER